MKLLLFLSMLCIVVTALSGNGDLQTYELHFNWLNLLEEPTIEVKGGTKAQLRMDAYAVPEVTPNDVYSITLTLRGPADTSDDVLSLLELSGVNIVQNSKTFVNLILSNEVNSVVELKVDAFTHGDIKTHAVDLVPVLVSSSVSSLDLDAVTLPTLPIAITDNRHLKVGFTGEHGMGSTGNDANTLFVTVGSLDTTVALAEDLTLLVTLQDTTEGANGTVQTVTIPAGDSGVQKVEFHDIDPTLTYTVTLNATSEYVQIDSPSLTLAQSELDKKLILLDKKLILLDKKLDLLQKLIKEWNQTRIQVEADNQAGNLNSPVVVPTDSAEPTTAAETATNTTAEATVSKAIPVSVTKPLMKPTKPPKPTPSKPTKPPKPTPSKPTEPTVLVETPAESDMCEPRCAEGEQCEQAPGEEGVKCVPVDSYFMWWILVAFVVVLIIAVTGYLLFNHRAKVKVYVFGLWKSADTVQKSSKKGSSRKYTPLPTSIHDSLTHED